MELQYSDLLLSIASDKRELKALEQKLLEMLESVSGICSRKWKQIWEKQERGKQTGNIYGNEGCKLKHENQTKINVFCSLSSFLLTSKCPCSELCYMHNFLILQVASLPVKS